MTVKVVSLFDGISCGYMAMLSAGVDVTEYVAYEIDKYAIAASSHNFPNIEHKGDVFHADFTQHRGADFVIGGSPCTYWSIAQATDKREREPDGNGWILFMEYVRAIREINPRYFIYENNKSMSDEIKTAISNALGVQPVLINSALVSAQFRQRYYWVGVRKGDTYEQAMIPQPADRGILLKDVLDNMDTFNDLNEKGCPLTANYGKMNVSNFTRDKTRAASGAIECVCINPKNDKGVQPSIQDRIYSPNGKSPACTQFITNTCERVGDMSENGAQSGRIYSPEGKSTTLNAGGGGGGAKTGLYAIPAPLDAPDVYEVKGGYITTKKGHRYPVKLSDGFYRIRKLSVAECKRLQTVPDWFDLSVISNTQAYKCLGNGWTVEVIAHLIRHAISNMPNRSSLDYYL